VPLEYVSPPITVPSAVYEAAEFVMRRIGSEGAAASLAPAALDTVSGTVDGFRTLPQM
jgi:hypothetical protein